MCRFQHLPMEGDEKVHSVVFTLFIYLFFLDFTKDSKLFVYCVHFMFLILNLKNQIELLEIAGPTSPSVVTSL